MCYQFELIDDTCQAATADTSILGQIADAQAQSHPNPPRLLLSAVRRLSTGVLLDYSDVQAISTRYK